MSTHIDTASMVELLKDIDSYKINTIHKNGFEQSNLYDDTRVARCSFFLPRKEASSRRIHKERKSTVHILATILEGHCLVDETEYRDKLVSLMTNDMLKTVTSKHRVLRSAVIEALEAKEFAPPSKEVASVFCNMIGLNMIVLKPARATFFVAKQTQDPEDTRTVVLGQNTLEMYPTIDKARAVVEQGQLVEEISFKQMKIAELRTYAQRVFPSDASLSMDKRDQLIRKLEERFSSASN